MAGDWRWQGQDRRSQPRSVTFTWWGTRHHHQHPTVTDPIDPHFLTRRPPCTSRLETQPRTMAALVFQADDAAIRLGAATAVTGGAITRLLTTGASRPAASGDLLLAATLHTLSQQPAHAREFVTTKRCASQRRELIKQSNEAVRSRHTDLSLSGNSRFVLGTDSAATTMKCFTGKSMLSERSAPAAAAQVSPAASSSCWHTCLALQSSLL